MRVIAGTARRLPLVTPKGMETRPTTDRIKETLFNILQNDLPGCQNLEKTHLADRAIVIGQDCAGAINALDAKKMHFDIIFMDPPYQLNAEKEVLTAIADSKIADEDTQIIIEATLDREFSEDELACFDVVRVKEYKTNKHIFLQKSSLVNRIRRNSSLTLGAIGDMTLLKMEVIL